MATATSPNNIPKLVLSSAISSNSPYGALRGLRQLREERLQKELFLLDKNARLRSGVRGSQARKALLAKEKEVAAYRVLYEQPEGDITPDSLAKETTDAADLLAELEIQAESAKTTDVESRAKTILAGLGFSDAYMGRPVSSLSGGWKMRMALAAVLLQNTDIMILDEPTNFLDLLGIMWLQRHLTSIAEASDPPTLIFVSHDRDFISLCTDLVLIKDKALGYFHGDLPTYESSQAEKQLHLSKMKEAKDKQKEHMEKTIARNMKEGRAKNDQNKMRQAKSRQKKLNDRWGLEVNSHGGRFKLNRDLVGYHLSARAAIELDKEDRPVRFVLPEPPNLRFPGPLVSLEKVSFRYPPEGRDKKTPSPLVLAGLSLSVHMGDRVGILGLNGGGKSTLIKLLVGESIPTSGEMTVHTRMRLGYYSQHAVESLREMGQAEPALTALALLTREAGDDMDEGTIRALLGSLSLPGRLASEVPVRKLSGGQLVRLELARILWKGPHCLVLDEVTTHLDYEAVTALREALHDWEGAVVLVSHDRWFMRGVVEGLTEGYENSDDSGAEEETPRRRVVYELKAGQMTLLPGGVQEFERAVERRVRKLMAQDRCG